MALHSGGFGSDYINQPIAGGTAGSVIFIGAGSVLSENNPSFFWDSTNLFQKITSTLGKQLRLAYDGTHYVDFLVDSFGQATLTQTGSGKGDFTWSSSIVGNVSRIVCENQDATDTLSNASFKALAAHTTASPSLILANGTTAWTVSMLGLTSNLFSIANGSTIFGITTGGNVGINTTGPDRRLDVLDASNPQLRLTYTDGTVYTDFQTNSSGDLIVSPTSFRVGINGAPTVPFNVIYNGSAFTTVSRIQSASAAADRVGILTLLSFNGSTNGNDPFFLCSIGANDVFKISMVGNVGVNTVTPRRLIDTLSTVAPQLRLSYADNSVYGEFQTGSDGKVTFTTAGTLCGFVFGGNYRFATGTSALATNATEGFQHSNSSAGTPTGTPASIPTGQIPWEYDTTNDQVLFYNGAWKGISAGKVILGAEMTADQTITNSTTLTDATSLTVNVLAGKTYLFRFIIFQTSASVTAGIKLSVNGTCTATSIKFQAIDVAGTPLFGRGTALGGSVGLGVGTGDNFLEIEGSIQVNAAGTLKLQWAQSVADAVNGTTVQQNSYMECIQLA